MRKTSGQNAVLQRATHTAQRNDTELNQVNRFTLFFFHLADAFDPEELTVYSMGVQPMTLVLLPLCNIR